MIIIVEGLDQTGKTTLINKLAGYGKSYTVKTSKPKKFIETEGDVDEWQVAIYFEYNVLIRNALTNNSKIDTIFDRSYISEMVYGIKRGYDLLEDPSWEGYKFLENQIAEREHILIYLHNSNQVEIARRAKTMSEDYVKMEERDMLEQRYEKYLSQTKLRYKRYDTHLLDEETLFQKVLEDIGNAKL